MALVRRYSHGGQFPLVLYWMRTFKDFNFKVTSKCLSITLLGCDPGNKYHFFRALFGTWAIDDGHNICPNNHDDRVNISSAAQKGLTGQARVVTISGDPLFAELNDVHSIALDRDALIVQNILKTYQDTFDREATLKKSGLMLSEELVRHVIQRHKSDWRNALYFFEWASKQKDYSHGTGTFNGILDVLGKSRCFDIMWQLVDKMHEKSLVNDRTFMILVHRYSAHHMVEKAIETFYIREKYGLKLDIFAFRVLLMSLCRYKHVEEAESLLYMKREVFPPDIRSRNIILNGWCVRGSYREAKRFWNDIISSKYKPDVYTYGTYINCLTKAGKVGTAVKLFNAMWDKGCTPDVPICNCILDALCFKKKIPKALEIFQEMNGRGCTPDVATYNTLLKHMCKIRRMEKAYELLDEMEEKGCTPNEKTYNYFLKSLQSPEEVPDLWKRMERTGFVPCSDTYNLILKLFLRWNKLEKVRDVWEEMEENGIGHDQRSYTIMVHGLFVKGKLDAAYDYFRQMISKGMVPEPRTKLLVNAMDSRRKCQDATSPDLVAAADNKGKPKDTR